jgi:hypothetical protein
MHLSPGLRFFNQIAELADVEGGHHPVRVLTRSQVLRFQVLLFICDSCENLALMVLAFIHSQQTSWEVF